MDVRGLCPFVSCCLLGVDKPLWSKLVSSLKVVNPLVLTKGSNLALTKMKYILSDPFMWDGSSMISSWCWCSGSDNLHSLHAFAIPPDNDVKISLSSMMSIISWLCYCISLMTLIRSFIIISCGCPFYLVVIIIPTVDLLLYCFLLIQLLCFPDDIHWVKLLFCYFSLKWWRISSV